MASDERRTGQRNGCASSLRRRLPVTHWLPRYPLKDAVPDLIAGFTVGLTLIPQSMGYAALAGLEPQYGLYSAFLGSFVYILFGTVKEVNMGPGALLALLTYNYTHHLGAEFAVLLCFMAGCVELLFGILHLGFLVDFISVPVVSGFTSAAAVIIASAQVKGLLGLHFESESFLQTWSEVLAHAHESRLWDSVLGVCCCVALLSLKVCKEHLGDGRVVWFVCTARNAIVVLLSAGLAALLQATSETVPFELTGSVRSGLPPLRLPPFSAELNNRTLGFVEMVAELESGVIVVPVVAIIANVAIAKAFARGRVLDATQEMIALGLCNLAGSTVGSMPAMGSFSRSAVSNASGVRSPLSGLYTGAMVVLSLSLLTPYFYFIPRATLAAVIMCAVIFMVELDKVAPMWRSNKKDLLTFAVSFVTCLVLGMEVGLLIGVVVDVAFLLYTNARPQVQVETISAQEPRHFVVTPTQCMLFPAADFVRTEIQTELQTLDQKEKSSTLLPVVIDFSHVHSFDYTAAMGLEALVRDLSSQGRPVVLYKMNPSVLRTMRGACREQFVHAPAKDELTLLLGGGDHAETALLVSH